ncbi:MAG: hypothetical protein PVF98_13675, partial [Desulfobacterales bacterium]
GDLNPCCRRERPVSWTRLDDGDAIETEHPIFHIRVPKGIMKPVVPHEMRDVLDQTRRWGRNIEP